MKHLQNHGKWQGRYLYKHYSMANVKAIIDRVHYNTSISSATNEIMADEPIVNGGKETGFSPTELLASSLAACTAITLRMYADRKEIPMKKAEIDIDVTWDGQTNTTLIKRNIHLYGDLTSEMKSRLIDIANKCPVHKILSNPITIDTELQ